MSKRDLLRFLFKWKWTIIGTFLFIVMTVTLLVYLTPPMYYGQSIVLIERNKAPDMRSDFVDMDTTEVINTEMEMVLSHSVMREVVDKLKPHTQPHRDSIIYRYLRSFRNSLIDIGLININSPAEGWVVNLMASVHVKPVVNSNIIKISYSNEDPKWAADIVNAVTDAYLHLHTKTYSSKGSVVFFKQRMQNVLIKLSGMQKNIDNFNEKHGVIAPDESVKRMTGEISNLRSMIMDSRGQLAEILDKYEPGHDKVLTIKKKIYTMNLYLDQLKGNLMTLDRNILELSGMKALITAEKKLLLNYKKRYDEAKLKEISPAALINIRIVEYSTIPEAPAKSRLSFILIASIIGFSISLAVAFLREYFDHSMSDPAMVEDIIGIPQAGSVEWFK